MTLYHLSHHMPCSQDWIRLYEYSVRFLYDRMTLQTLLSLGILTSLQNLMPNLMTIPSRQKKVTDTNEIKKVFPGSRPSLRHMIVTCVESGRVTTVSDDNQFEINENYIPHNFTSVGISHAFRIGIG
ncbi:hypothetical protein RvY_05357 [Ramazzottius varieornatus]|uniref:Uncharacterized protein n=1 Tax=Ramazzottius varieornatus TaxID=947166 RepID=A0A1D1UUS7_RAMVA|nr:hypothetical protein RvY_05357 [Ramazzottius varieornatus]